MTSFCYLHGTACLQNCACSYPNETCEKWFNPQIKREWLKIIRNYVELRYYIDVVYDAKLDYPAQEPLYLVTN